jgi:hypothetical protein
MLGIAGGFALVRVPWVVVAAGVWGKAGVFLVLALAGALLGKRLGLARAQAQLRRTIGEIRASVTAV